MKHFALAGNPNCGKTTAFNSLTGSTAHVGNWPGVTVDKREGTYKKCAEPIAIVDLPGIYSLSPYTPEEVISRNYITDEKPDCVINIVDATNLERNLYLTTQIMEMDVPMVVALNMMDAVSKSGDKIDSKRLEKELGVPVVEISALRERGLDELMSRAYEVCTTPRSGVSVLSSSNLKHLIGDVRIGLEGQGVANPLFHAIKLVELDEIEVGMHPDSVKMVEDFKKTFSDDTFGTDFEAIVADARYKYISKHFSPTYVSAKVAATDSNGKATFAATGSDKIDRVLTHRVWGIPIFLVVLFFVFHLTFSEDLFYIGAAGGFNSDTYAYTAGGTRIEVFYDSEGNELESLTDDEGNVVALFSLDGIQYTQFFDEDGREVELEVEDGELVGLALVDLLFDADGNPIKQLYGANGVMLVNIESGVSAVITNDDGELIDLYDANGEVYYADKDFYLADGYRASIITSESGRFESVGYVSGVDEYMSGVSVHTFFGYEEGIFSPGVILFNTLDFITGLITTAVGDGLGLASAPEWLNGFICDGVLGGLFAIMSFLPQILILFLFFSILEDSGYMARIAFILDRIFRKFGLSGRAFMPMIMGFGCSIPAMINTRTLADQNERVSTVRVIPFFSCGAKLPILTAIAGGIVQLFGVGNADLITYGMYALGIITAIVAVILMRSTTLKGDVAPFIMELPSYHFPQFKNLMIHLWDKAKHFIKKAFTIILASTIVIWFVSHFSWNWTYLPDEMMNDSILAGLGQLIQPLFTPIGFGSQLGSFGWVFVVAAITGLIAKENVIATFATLAACVTPGFVANEALEGVDAVAQLINVTGITIPALIAFIAFNMTTIPCFAAVATARAELPTKKSFRWTLLFWIATSYLLGTMVYLVGSWWWTCFIFIAIIAVAIALIVLHNKNKLPKFFKRKGG